MERILIIGCAGAGKTTLSRQLGQKLDLPRIHLDSIYWSPGNWEHLDRAAFDAALNVELAKPRWIMEGNYDRTLPLRLESCDTVFWLDYSRWVCMCRWLKRMTTNWNTVRPDMAPGCLERFEWDFAKFIWTFNQEHRDKYEHLFANCPDKKLYRFRSPRKLKKFLKTL